MNPPRIEIGLVEGDLFTTVGQLLNTGEGVVLVSERHGEELPIPEFQDIREIADYLMTRMMLDGNIP